MHYLQFLIPKAWGWISNLKEENSKFWKSGNFWPICFSSQKEARHLILETGILSLVEDYLGSDGIDGNSDCILRCLYTIGNILMIVPIDSEPWVPSSATISKINELSSSLTASPAVVEKAASVAKLIKM